MNLIKMHSTVHVIIIIITLQENRRRENKRGEIETENLRDKQPYMGYKPEYIMQIQKMNDRNKKMQNNNRYSKYKQQKDKNTENEITEVKKNILIRFILINYLYVGRIGGNRSNAENRKCNR